MCAGTVYIPGPRDGLLVLRVVGLLLISSSLGSGMSAAAESNVDDVAVPVSSRRTRVDSTDTPAAERRRSSSPPAAARGTAYPPRSVFRPTPRNITVSPGERAVLRCRVENLGTKMVTWRKRDEIHPLTIGMFQFAPDTRISVDYNHRTTEWSLIIQDVKPSDEGVYCCQISTKHDRDTYDIRLNVRTIQVEGSEYVEATSPIQLTCNATGRPDPPHNVDWHKDGNKVRSDANGGVIITKKIETRVLVSMLVIRRSQESDSGTYVCRSSNGETGTIVVHVLKKTPSSSAEKRRNAAGDVPVHGHFSRDAAATTPSASFVVILSAPMLQQLLVRLTAVAAVTR